MNPSPVFPVASPAHAVCPEHPTRAALRTCLRCGRFVCDECGGDSATCPACVQQLQLQVPSSRGRAKAAAVFLWLCAGGYASAYVATVGHDPLGEPSLMEGMAMMAAGVLTLVAFIGAVISFLMWQHRVVRQVNALGHDVGVTPGWAVGWWFIPFANLVKPYHAVRGIVSVLGGESLVRRLAVGWWWGAWILFNVLSNLETRLEQFASDKVGGSSGFQFLSLVVTVLGVIAALLCARLVRAVQSELDARRASTAR